MSTNWQPPFGLPFPMPPPPPLQVQNAQPEGQGGPSDQYHAPAPEAYRTPWNLPGLNLQAYGQNAQQPQYPHAPHATGECPAPSQHLSCLFLVDCH